MSARVLASVGCIASIVAICPAHDPAVTSDREADLVRVPGTDVSFTLVRTPAGSIDLDGETHEVEALLVSETEITWDLFDIYLYSLDAPEEGADPAVDAVSRPSKPYVPPDRGFGHRGYAAISMTRHAAEQFCAWLSAKTGHTYRLPTEAEWVHAALAGTEGDYAFADAAEIDRHAWHDGNSGWTPHPVGKKLPNAWGLHDVHGNVAEWVMPMDPADEGPPFALGGSYLEYPEDCTVRSKLVQQKSWQASDPQIPKSQWWLADCGYVGFRIVREIEPAEDAE